MANKKIVLPNAANNEILVNLYETIRLTNEGKKLGCTSKITEGNCIIEFDEKHANTIAKGILHFSKNKPTMIREELSRWAKDIQLY